MVSFIFFIFVTPQNKVMNIFTAKASESSMNTVMVHGLSAFTMGFLRLCLFFISAIAMFNRRKNETVVSLAEQGKSV